MGLLDDAIREHLDLKRRHGADPAEIERAEREALGPVRRGPEESGALGQPGEQLFASGEDLEAEWDEAYEEDDDELSQLDDPEFDLPDEELDDDALELDDDPLVTDGDKGAGEHHGFAHQDTAAAAPGPAPAPVPAGHPSARDPLDEETEEYEVEDALPEEPAHRSQDMLEETPEFLQDAPDHDRLWFEQRPPRDFDFDG
jgi:hypothetical protein